ncbi:unnamed protein product [Closterium sp. Naga37s-1]|nr:unnamed protein product [Closterium sp. Naga37s-1]
MADLKADLKKPLLPPRRPPVPTIIPPQPPPVGGLSAALPGPPQAQFRLGGKPPPAPAPSAAPLSPRLSPLLTPHFTGTAASRDLGSASSASGSIASGGTGTSAVTNGLRGGGGGGLGGAGGVGGGFGGAGAPPPPPVGPKKKRGQGVRSWIRIDPSGEVSILEVDKGTLMRRCDLPGRDLRLLDPVFVYPSTILGRERAMVVNLESIRCIITADEVLLLNVTDPAVQQFKQALQRRLLLGMAAPSDFRVLWGTERPGENGFTLDAPNASIQRREISSEDMFSGSGSTAEEDDLPFEFKALELALELSCSGLDRQAQELAQEAYPLLERLAFQISTTNLELVRRIKSSLLGLTRRVQKVRDEIEQLMDDDGDMAEMYLTQKRLLAEERSESERLGGHRDDGSDHSHTPRESLGGFGSSISAPVSPAGSPTKHTPRLASHQPPFNNYQERHYLDGQPSGMGASDSTATSVENVEELEMLLEAYFVVIDGMMNKLTPTPSFFPFPLSSPSHIQPQGSHYLDGRPSGLGGAPPSISFWSGAHSASDSTATSVENVEELEMLLEAYFVVIDGTLNKPTPTPSFFPFPLPSPSHIKPQGSHYLDGRPSGLGGAPPSISFWSGAHSASDSTATSVENVEELEMLLEAYFVVIDGTLNKLTPTPSFFPFPLSSPSHIQPQGSHYLDGRPSGLGGAPPSISFWSGAHSASDSTATSVENVEELEMLLEAYFVVIDGTLNKPTPTPSFFPFPLPSPSHIEPQGSHYLDGRPSGLGGAPPSISFWSGAHSASDSTATSVENVEELEMLLEAYFVVIDGTLNKLTPTPSFFPFPLPSPSHTEPQGSHYLDGRPSGLGGAPPSISFWSDAHSASDSTATSVENVEELEMLLEAYFVVIDGTLNKPTPTPYFFPFPLPSPSHIEPQGSHYLDGRPSGLGGAPPSISFWSGAHSASDSTATSVENVEELEMLLEAYFVVIDGTLNKLTPTPSFFPFPLSSPSHFQPQGSHYLDGRPSGLGGAPPSISFWSGAHSASDSTATSVENVEELEMLLEAYFVVIDGTLNKPTPTPYFFPFPLPSPSHIEPQGSHYLDGRPSGLGGAPPSISFWSGAHSASDSTATSLENVEELEMLLEAYFVVIDGTLNKLTPTPSFFPFPLPSPSHTEPQGSHYLDGRPSGLGGAPPSISFWSGAHSASDSTATSVENVEELEMLLEAYFVVIDGTLNKLTQLSQYIDDTEDFINIQLDNVRNQLIQFELIMTTAGAVCGGAGGGDCASGTGEEGGWAVQEGHVDSSTVPGLCKHSPLPPLPTPVSCCPLQSHLSTSSHPLAGFEVVLWGVIGMNVPLGLEEDPSALKWILIDSGVGGAGTTPLVKHRFVVALWGVIAGTFGMNVPLGLEEDPSALKWILIDSGVGGVLIFLAFLAFFRYKNWTIT